MVAEWIKNFFIGVVVVALIGGFFALIGRTPERNTVLLSAAMVVVYPTMMVLAQLWRER